MTYLTNLNSDTRLLKIQHLEKMERFDNHGPQAGGS